MSNRLPVLMEAARAAHAGVTHHAGLAAERALEAGASLCEAKALCGHGTWGAWLAETGIRERTAQRYMKLHRGGLTSATVADLGFARAEDLATAGLRLWPAEGEGRVACWWDAGDFGGASAWWPEGDGLVGYEAVTILPPPDLAADVFRRPALLPPWALGALEGELREADHRSLRAVPAAEARTFVATLLGDEVTV